MKEEETAENLPPIPALPWEDFVEKFLVNKSLLPGLVGSAPQDFKRFVGLACKRAMLLMPDQYRAPAAAANLYITELGSFRSLEQILAHPLCAADKDQSLIDAALIALCGLELLKLQDDPGHLPSSALKRWSCLASPKVIENCNTVQEPSMDHEKRRIDWVEFSLSKGEERDCAKTNIEVRRLDRSGKKKSREALIIAALTENRSLTAGEIKAKTGIPVSTVNRLIRDSPHKVLKAIRQLRAVKGRPKRERRIPIDEIINE